MIFLSIFYRTKLKLLLLLNKPFEIKNFLYGGFNENLKYYFSFKNNINNYNCQLI